MTITFSAGPCRLNYSGCVSNKAIRQYCKTRVQSNDVKNYIKSRSGKESTRGWFRGMNDEGKVKYYRE